MERKLTAILCADVYGYSRLMGEDEEATLRTLSAYRKIIDSFIETHRGRFVNSAGDSVLAEFTSVVEAVNCAVEIQTSLKAENADLPSQRRMEFRIGVNLGDVMAEGEQIYGDGVNFAARLESLASPGGICISGTVYEQVRDKLALRYEDRGLQPVKNIARPVHVWRAVLDGTATPGRRLPRKYWRGGVLSLSGLAIVIGTLTFVQRLSLKPPRTSASIPPLQKAPLPLPSIPSIAVLPFTNMSGDPQQEYFSNGISAQLINELSRVSGLFVIARNSSFAYKGKAIKEQDIGKELGVKYVLEGSVQKSPNRVRIGVELVDATSGAEVWTGRFDRPLKDIFAIQDDIVSKVRTTLGLLLKLGEMKIPRGGSARPTDSLEAYDEFLRGLEYTFRWTKEDNAKARQSYQDAVKMDPKFGEAYALLGWSYWTDIWNQWSANPGQDFQRASELAHQTLALDDSNTDALALLSATDWAQGRFDQAVAEAQRAVAINPNSAMDYKGLSDALINAGRATAALDAAKKAIRLDPASEDLDSYALGNAYLTMGRYQDAIAALKRTTGAYPNLLVAHLTLAASYVEVGRDQDAHAQAAEIVRISPHHTAASWPHTKDEARSKRFEADLRKAGLK